MEKTYQAAILCHLLNGMQEIERESAPDRQCAADFPLIFTPPHILAVLNLAVVVVTPSSDPGSLVENREKVCHLL